MEIRRCFPRDRIGLPHVAEINVQINQRGVLEPVGPHHLYQDIRVVHVERSDAGGGDKGEDAFVEGFVRWNHRFVDIMSHVFPKLFHGHVKCRENAVRFF